MHSVNHVTSLNAHLFKLQLFFRRKDDKMPCKIKFFPSSSNLENVLLLDLHASIFPLPQSLTLASFQMGQRWKV